MRRCPDGKLLGTLLALRAVPGASGSQPCGLRAWIAARLRADLADPVRVQWFRNRHVVTAMRGVEITVHRRARVVTVRGRCDPSRGQWIDGNLDLRRPLGGRDWAIAWWMMILPRMPTHLRSEAMRLSMADASTLVNVEARGSGLLPQTRRDVLVALQLDRGILWRTRDMCRGTRFSTYEYSLVWLHARATRACSARSPALWPLYGCIIA